MKNRNIMLQGTSSSVGKSILAAALCRIFYEDGYNVSPFKSQNMSSLYYETEDGLIMSRAQALQAQACGKDPNVCMNPILLKPNTDRKSQVYILGKLYDTMDANKYFSFKPRLKEDIRNIYKKIEGSNDIIVIEGAGSPAEINLKNEDFVNMGMAEIANSPVILIGDIDRGGVFASIVGTLMLLSDEERKYVKGVIINKFRGSFELLEPGLKMLKDIIKIPILGVIPYFQHCLEEEDSQGDKKEGSGNIELEKSLDDLSYIVRKNLDIDRIYSIMEEGVNA